MGAARRGTPRHAAGRAAWASPALRAPRGVPRRAAARSAVALGSRNLGHIVEILAENSSFWAVLFVVICCAGLSWSCSAQVRH